MLSPTETLGWLTRASQKSTWKGKTARNLSQIAAKIRGGHTALRDKETNGSAGRRLGMVISQAMLPAIRREPAVKCYLASRSSKYNRKLVRSHEPVNTHTAVWGRKMSRSYSILLLISLEEQSQQLSWGGQRALSWSIIWSGKSMARGAAKMLVKHSSPRHPWQGKSRDIFPGQASAYGL